MERLTKTTEIGNAYFPKCFEEPCCGMGKCIDNNCNLVNEVCKKLAEYETLEEQGLLVRLPCKVGDIVYVDSEMLPIEDMECYEDIDNKIPSYFQGRVVSFRFAQRKWAKIAVKEKWLYEWIDDETRPENDYIEYERYFSILLSTIGKTVFLTREEAEKKLEVMKK